MEIGVNFKIILRFLYLFCFSAVPCLFLRSAATPNVTRAGIKLKKYSKTQYSKYLFNYSGVNFKIILRFLYLFCFSAAWGYCLTGCAVSEPGITQISTIDALLNGLYDGTESIGTLKSYGDLGIGTIDRLDGEMLILDGVAYQVRSDGKVNIIPDNGTTPFACVANFTPEHSVPLQNIPSFHAFETKMGEFVENNNIMIAFHVKGRFRKMLTRSVPRQEPPYRPLSMVAKEQSEFEFTDVEGDIVGFYLPGYMKSINVPFYHLHFINNERTAGGHVLDFELDSAVIMFCCIYNFNLILPRNSAEFAAVDLNVDRSGELKQVESKR